MANQKNRDMVQMNNSQYKKTVSHKFSNFQDDDQIMTQTIFAFERAQTEWMQTAGLGLAARVPGKRIFQQLNLNSIQIPGTR
jgi:hypothetical protein